MPLGDFVDRVMDAFYPLSKAPNWHEFCQACDTMLMSDTSLCCTPLQPAKHGLLTLGAELAADFVKPRGYVGPARFGRPLIRDQASLLNEPATTRARRYRVALHARTDEGRRAKLDGQSRRSLISDQRGSLWLSPPTRL